MLSDRRIRALKPAPRDKWYCDGNGLYLRVRATGGRSWVDEAIAAILSAIRELMNPATPKHRSIGFTADLDEK